MRNYDETLAITTELLRPYVQAGASVAPTANIQADLGLDSIAVMEFAADLEARFGIDIPSSEYEKLFTVADVARAVVRLSESAPAAKGDAPAAGV